MNWFTRCDPQAAESVVSTSEMDKLNAFAFPGSISMVPGPVLRETLRELKGNHQPGAISYVDAFLQPNAQVAELGRMLLWHEKFRPAHQSFYVQGITELLLDQCGVGPELCLSSCSSHLRPARQ
jgi:hypothetical protein